MSSLMTSLFSKKPQATNNSAPMNVNTPNTSGQNLQQSVATNGQMTNGQNTNGQNTSMQNAPDTQAGGKKLVLKKTKAHHTYKNRKCVVYEGKRGGKYIRHNNAYVLISKL